MSISDGLGLSIFCRKMEWTRPVREVMGEKVLIFCQSQYFCFDVAIMKVICPICTSNWRENNYISRQGKDINKRNEEMKLPN